MRRFLILVVFLPLLPFSHAQDAGPKAACLGRIVPGERIFYIASPEQGPVGALNVKRGDIVNKGQILAVTSSAPLRAAAAEKAKAAVALAKQKLEVLMLGEPLAIAAGQEAVVKARETALKNAITNSEFEISEDRSKSDVHYAKMKAIEAEEGLFQAKALLYNLMKPRPADLALAEKEIDLAKAGLAEAEAALEACNVRAPAGGSVLEIYAYPGEAPGLNGILALADTANMFAEAQVYVTDAGKIKIGDSALVSGDAFEGKLTGKVVEISPMSDFNSVFPADPFAMADRRVIKARIKLDPNDSARKAINTQVNIQIGGGGN